MDILSRSNKQLFSTPTDCDDPSPIRTAAVKAVQNRVLLADAALSWANLARAVLKGAELMHADLSCSNLTGADLRDAHLTRASLTGATLAHADLSEAALAGASLRRADLRHANLCRANLRDADLQGAELEGARLTCADLRGANFERSTLYEADLDAIFDDLRQILDCAPHEALALCKRVRAGQVDGCRYENTCGTLIGTIAEIRGCPYDQLGDLKPDPRRPAERWCLALERGKTPENHYLTRVTDVWITAWGVVHELNGHRPTAHTSVRYIGS